MKLRDADQDTGYRAGSGLAHTVCMLACWDRDRIYIRG